MSTMTSDDDPESGDKHPADAILHHLLLPT
nr:hypothetical protein TnSNPV_2 [Trichoplusia ni single nucleopolyhedrovirus]